MQSIIACIDECDLVKPITLYTNFKKFKSIILVYKGIGVWRLPAPSCGQSSSITQFLVKKKVLLKIVGV